MTKIEWTDKTWNPVTGCTPVSPGCKNCYARVMARRLAGRHGYPEAPNHFDVTLRPDRLEQPLAWKKPRMIFLCSMSDLFHENVPFEFIDKVFAVMLSQSHHTYQILTKRVTRMVEWYVYDVKKRGVRLVSPHHIWLGVSVCNQSEVWKARELLRIYSFSTHFVSVEPMLGEVNLQSNQDGFLLFNIGGWPTLDWVICGAETGPGKRPMPLDAAISLRDQCIEANVPFFFKRDSLGNRTLEGVRWEEYPK